MKPYRDKQAKAEAMYNKRRLNKEEAQTLSSLKARATEVRTCCALETQEGECQSKVRYKDIRMYVANRPQC